MIRARSGEQPGLLDALVRLGASQPIAEPVPSDDAFYRQSKGRLHIASRTARRWLQCRLSGQQAHLHEHIASDWKRALWIHAEAPQLGDALMDLAPRSLLAAHGFTTDVLTTPMMASLLAGDRCLRKSLADPAELVAADYDVVICTSHSAESLAVKRQCLPALPWVSLKGLYQGYDYHRGCFVARRLAGLMDAVLDDRAYRFHSRQKLSPALDHPVPADAGVSIAVGGVRAERSYAHWPAVVQALHRGGVASVTLIGSANGSEAAAQVVAAAPAGLAVTDHVARLDLHATRRAIAASRLLLCADGGLMHLGFTTQTPVLALFTRAIDPAWRVPLDDDGAVLRSTGADVSAITPDAITCEALRRLG